MCVVTMFCPYSWNAPHHTSQVLHTPLHPSFLTDIYSQSCGRCFTFYVLCCNISSKRTLDPRFHTRSAQHKKKEKLITKSVLFICESVLKHFANFKKSSCDSFQSKSSTQITQNITLWWGRQYILIKIEDHRHYLCQYHVVKIAPCSLSTHIYTDVE